MAKKNNTDWEVVVVNPEMTEKAAEKFLNLIWEAYKNSPRFIKDMEKMKQHNTNDEKA